MYGLKVEGARWEWGEKNYKERQERCLQLLQAVTVMNLNLQGGFWGSSSMGVFPLLD